MTTTVEETLLDTVHKIGPRIRELGEVGERERRLPRETFELMRDAGLLRLFAPRSFGGLEVDPPMHARVMEELARYDSATGWVLQGTSSSAWHFSRLPDEGAEEIYADGPDIVATAAFSPPIEARPVDGGFLVRGRRAFASNCGDSSWLWMTALLMEGDQPKIVDGAPVVMAVFFRAEEATIHDTWNTFGMRGTNSNDIEVADVFVPERRAFVFDPNWRIGRHYPGPLYRFPDMGLVGVFVSPVLLGVAREAITEALDVAQGKTPFNSATTLRERASAQAKVGLAEATLRSARAFLNEQVEDVWRRTQAGETLSLEQKADLYLAGVHAQQSAARATEVVHSAAGTTGIYERSRLARLFRDAQVIKHHGFVSESRYETVGQVYLGLPPDLGFLAL